MDETGSDHHEHTNEAEHLRLAQINHQEYDALADLFLGDGGYGPEPIGSERETPVPDHSTHTPVLHLTRHELDAELEEQTEPILHAQPSTMSILQSLDETDARASALLAELLGERACVDEFSPVEVDDAQQSPPPQEHALTIEVVLLGHLPVRATLWARQYACVRSREKNEMVALIRAASGSTSLDLISADAPIGSAPTPHLERALDLINEHADRVILRVDEGSEPELLDRPEIDEITILSGADEAAVVASYRLIKALDARFSDRDQASLHDGPPPLLRVAVLGSSEAQAADACAKLRNAVETFIKRPIEIVVGSGRIDARGTTNIYRDSAAHQATRILDGLIESGGRSKSRQDSERAPSPARAHDSEPGNETPRVEFPASGVRVLAKAVKPIPELDPGHRKETNDQESSIGTDAATIRDGLCALIPGLAPIEARCPKAPGVELAIDDCGQLHLLVSDADTDDVMNRLLAAQSWAKNNLGLLIRAEPDLAMPSTDRDADTDAAMHLISIDPRSVHEIYDTPVHVYALARVKVGQVVAQVATPIN